MTSQHPVWTDGEQPASEGGIDETSVAAQILQILQAWTREATDDLMTVDRDAREYGITDLSNPDTAGHWNIVALERTLKSLQDSLDALAKQLEHES